MVVAQDIKIKLAGVQQLEDLTPLFDAYRVWYGKESNLPAANHFLFERIINHESVIFMAYKGSEAVGFTQLYMTFSSVEVMPMWILNDLYIKEEYRNTGIGRSLINQAIELVKERGDRGLVIETAPSNTGAQKLYESIGFIKDDFYHYHYWL